MSVPTVAVLGTGSIGMRHLEAARALGLNVIAVPLRAARRRELAELGFRVADGLASAVTLGATHLVIATDTQRHAEDAGRALALGGHVLVEKPVAESGATAEAILRHPNAKSRVRVAYCLRFDPALRHFRARLPGLGHVHSVQIVCQSYLPDWRPNRAFKESYSARKGEGGVLRDLSHEIDYARWLFGAPRTTRSLMQTRSLLGIAAEEAVNILWSTEAQTHVSIRLDYLTRHARRSVLAQGEHGELEWHALRGEVELRLVDGSVENVLHPPDRDALFRAQMLDFISPVAEESRESCSLEEAIATAKVCDELHQHAVASPV